MKGRKGGGGRENGATMEEEKETSIDVMKEKSRNVYVCVCVRNAVFG